MIAYVIFQETIHDPFKFEEYKKLSPSSIERFGGRFIVRGGPIDRLEGAFEYERVVIIEFPDRESARAWHGSSEYAAAKAMRQEISEGQALLVEGLDLSLCSDP